MGLLTTKSISVLQAEASAEGEGTLKRALGALNLTMLGIGAIIGAGIFVLTGTAAALYAGPAIVLSFMLAGTACLFAGLCYAEFAAMIPISGSAYTYGYATLGEFVAWIIGWDLILEYLLGASTVAVGWSGYFVHFMDRIGLHIPTSLTGAPINFVNGHMVAVPGAIVNLPALVLIGLMTILLVVGIKESASFNNVIVILKVAIVVLVIGFGFMFVHGANWHPFIPPAEGPGHFGFSGIMRGAGVIFFAYIGFDAVSTTAQEAKNPQRDMPIGILSSLAICTVLYILMALVMTGLVPFRQLNAANPVQVALDAAGPGLQWLNDFTSVGAILGLASVVLVMLMGQPRIFFSMSKDGLLPPVFSKVHPRFKTPYVPTILTGIVAAVPAALLPIGELAELVSIGTLLAFVIVCLGVLILHYKRPDLHRPFRTPFVPVVPALGALICLYLMYNLPGATWLRLVVWMAVGLIIYFTYGRSHSHVQRSEAMGAD